MHFVLEQVVVPKKVIFFVSSKRIVNHGVLLVSHYFARVQPNPNRMYHKVVVATASNYSLPILVSLLDANRLQEILIPESYGVVKSMLMGPVPEEKFKLIPDGSDLPTAADCDLVILMGYPHEIAPPTGVTVVKIHFGPLPENRGPDPLFWTLKNGKNLAYIAVHEVTDQYDTGDVFLEKGIDILPNETFGLLWARLAQMAVPVVQALIQGTYRTTPQDESKAQYYPRPSENDLTVDWNTMSAQEIHRLALASNPKYGGAITTIHQAPMRLLEVSPANVNMEEGSPSPKPGTIVHASPEQGIYVACKDNQFLRLNIVSTGEGVFSDYRLAGLGNTTGMVLGN